VRDNRSRNAGDHTGCNGHAHLGAATEGGTVGQHRIHSFGCSTLDGELGHGVRHLLEEDRDETRVPAGESLHLVKLLDALDGALGEVGVGNATDTSSLQRAEEDVSDELGASRRAEVDGITVVPGLLVTKRLRERDLEELEAAELEPAWRTTGRRRRTTKKR